MFGGAVTRRHKEGLGYQVPSLERRRQLATDTWATPAIIRAAAKSFRGMHGAVSDMPSVTPWTTCSRPSSSRHASRRPHHTRTGITPFGLAPFGVLPVVSGRLRPMQAGLVARPSENDTAKLDSTATRCTPQPLLQASARRLPLHKRVRPTCVVVVLAVRMVLGNARRRVGLRCVCG